MRIRFAMLFMLGGLAASATHASTFTINSNGDAGLANSGGTSCDTGGTVTIPGAGTLPECTLRAAIQAANNTAGSVDIEYATALECSDLNQIRLDSLLPNITGSLHIHGDTHPCAGGTADHYPTVVPDEPFSLSHGLRLQGASNVVIENMGLTGFSAGGAAIEIRGNSENVLLDSVQVGLNAGVGLDVWEANDVTITNSSFTFNTIRNIWFDNADGFILQDSTASNSGSGPGILVANGSVGSIGRITGQLPNRICRGNTISSNDEAGIRVISDSQVVIRCNTISGNGDSGIELVSDDNVVGNSTEPGGLVIPPSGGNTIRNNDAHGIHVGENTEGNIIGFNSIGGTEASPGMGNELNGVVVEGGTTYIQNNSISYNDGNGIVVTEQGRAVIRGNGIIGNASNGIFSTRNLTRIGGEEAAEANVIGLNDTGIWFEAPSGLGFPSIGGNFIGTNSDGDDLGNDQDGIVIRNPSVTSYIGQLSISGTPRVPNVIGFNNRGIFIHHGDDVRISSNYIGTNADGDDLGNTSTGVALAMTSNSRVGSTATGAILPPIDGFPNIIANSDTGVQLSGAGTATINNPIRGNSFRGNGQAISLSGYTDIDPGGGSTGPNRHQNYPEIDAEETWYDADTDTLHFRYRVQTNASNAAYPLRIDFYMADGSTAQGRTFVGTVTYQSASANAWEVGTLQPASGVNMAGYLTATATDSDGNTSQFFPDPVDLDDGNGEPGPGEDEIFHDRFED
jgi:parallel beta-helix repeat protein